MTNLGLWSNDRLRFNAYSYFMTYEKEMLQTRVLQHLLDVLWSWRGLNPRPNGELTSFLHA